MLAADCSAGYAADMALVFKIIGEADYAASRASGFIVPAAVDRTDGFIHLSAKDQVLQTARLYFAGRDDLIIVGFDAELLGAALRWEVSRGSALFPHYYGALSMTLAANTLRLIRRTDGSFAFGNTVP